MIDQLLALAVAGQPTQNLSIFDPASPPAESIRNLSYLVIAIAGFIYNGTPLPMVATIAFCAVGAFVLSFVTLDWRATAAAQAAE